MIKIESVDIPKELQNEIKDYFKPKTVEKTKGKRKPRTKKDKVYEKVKDYIFKKPQEINEIIKRMGTVNGDKEINDVYDGFKIKIQAFYFDILKLRVCPYCNETPIYYIENSSKNYQNFEFDHIMPKDKYPYLALSLYNLVPVCKYCNSKKGNKEGLPNIYLDEIMYNYNIIPRDDGDFINLEDFKIIKRNLLNADNLDKLLHLENRYNLSLHKEYLVNLLKKIEYYNKDRIDDLLDSGLFSTKDEILNRVFEEIRIIANDSNKPRHKLTRDILEQFKVLGIIENYY